MLRKNPTQRDTRVEKRRSRHARGRGSLCAGGIRSMRSRRDEHATDLPSAAYLDDGLYRVCAWCRVACDENGDPISAQRVPLAHLDERVTHGMCRECAESIRSELR